MSVYGIELINYTADSPLFYCQKNPGLSTTPVKNCPGPFRSPLKFKYKEKNSIYLQYSRVQSIAENSA